MMGRFPLPCTFFFFLSPFFFSACTSTQVRMAELPGNSQKPLAFGTICPAAFLLSLIRKEWGWMQSTSSPLDVMRLWKLGLLYSFSTPSFLRPALLNFLCSFSSLHLLSTIDFLISACTVYRQKTKQLLIQNYCLNATRLTCAHMTVSMYKGERETEGERS